VDVDKPRASQLDQQSLITWV